MDFEYSAERTVLIYSCRYYIYEVSEEQYVMRFVLI